MSTPTIRLATASDAAAVAAIYAAYVRDTAISFETTPPDTATMARRIDHTLQRLPWLVGEIGGRIVGYAYAGELRQRPAYRWAVEVSVYVDLTARRTGLGRELYRVLLDMLAAQGHVQAFAGITLPNDASIGLHRTLGFAHVGTWHDVGFKLGRWHDISWWQRRLREPADTPADPLAPPGQGCPVDQVTAPLGM
ncbi:arsinothricin resistance N-acetyltransferase ArsN1 family B [Pseudonocardia dioxanivorans]|uniref:arsinothricin resistance N-acetyltransferase ArsN1 family B n=1 Tax=Pseudonocardia dioxanivorans TaxID=240495 RepID=UPI000CD07870|nr:arsinothricin resistance N-acetyltransferase ArsN1 family B [Pseudonocardia dioxanivorans]